MRIRGGMDVLLGGLLALGLFDRRMRHALVFWDSVDEGSLYYM